MTLVDTAWTGSTLYYSKAAPTTLSAVHLPPTSSPTSSYVSAVHLLVCMVQTVLPFEPPFTESTRCV